MKRNLIVISLVLSAAFLYAQGGGKAMDTFSFGSDTLEIGFYGHASFMIDFNGLVVQIDPVSRYADYGQAPKADIVLVTHEHQDHLDPAAIAKASKEDTEIITNAACAAALKKGRAIANGQKIGIKGIGIEAVPAYNTSAGRDKFHPKGRDNGFILTFGKARIYVAGDTEPIPEMSGFAPVDIAFLPVNQPYTMTVEQAADAAAAIKPKVLYPYHYGNTDPAALAAALGAVKGVEVRMRNME